MSPMATNRNSLQTCYLCFIQGHTPEDYVADYFRKDAYMRTYTAVIYPVPDEHSWTKIDSPDIDPPKFDKHVGRPKKSRRRGPDEGPRVQGPARKTTSTCSNCRRDGHTYRTCGKPLRPDLQLRAANIKVSLTFINFAANFYINN